MNTDRSFWTTLPGVLTALAAVLTAVGGILGFVVRHEPTTDPERSLPSTPTTQPVAHRTPTDVSPPPTRLINVPAGSATTTKASPTTTSTSGTAPTATTGTTPPATSPATGSAAPTTATTPPPAGFRVVEVVLRADPFQYDGACPVTIRFSGRISVVGGAGTVAYRFLRSDGASDTVKTVHFDGAGSASIEHTWRRGEGSGWEQLEILDPEPTRRSDKATFTITCR